MNQKTLVGVLAVLVLILGGTTIYFLTAQKSVTPVVPTPAPVSKTVPVPEKTSPVVQNTPAVPVAQDEIAGWKTYTSSTYNYSVQYPSSWTIKDAALDVESKGKFIAFLDKGTEKARITTDLISNDMNGNKMTLSALADGVSPTDKTTITKKENVLIGGKSGIKEYVSISDPKSEGFWYFMENGNYYYTIISREAIPSKEFNQILSTFKFTK